MKFDIFSKVIFIILLPLFIQIKVVLANGEASEVSYIQSHAADPWEPLNRKVYRFNSVVDRWTLRPVARFYQWSVPTGLRNSIRHFFGNLQEPGRSINSALQGKWRDSGHSLVRFGLNTTVGVIGIFDVAADVGLEALNEDFGQTFAHWGWQESRYLVLPFLGPSSIRDTFGRGGDVIVDPTQQVQHVRTRNTVNGLSLLSVRTDLLSLEQLISGDEYAYVRDAYLQRRDFLIKDGQVEDSFLDDDF